MWTCWGRVESELKVWEFDSAPPLHIEVFAFHIFHNTLHAAWPNSFSGAQAAASYENMIPLMLNTRERDLLRLWSLDELELELELLLEEELRLLFFFFFSWLFLPSSFFRFFFCFAFFFFFDSFFLCFFGGGLLSDSSFELEDDRLSLSESICDLQPKLRAISALGWYDATAGLLTSKIEVLRKHR